VGQSSNSFLFGSAIRPTLWIAPGGQAAPSRLWYCPIGVTFGRLRMITSLIQTVAGGKHDRSKVVALGRANSPSSVGDFKVNPSDQRAARRISVVDDEENIHQLVKDLGELGHFTVMDSFYTGAQALDRIPENRPDAVIMDIRLPDMSGIECTAKLKTILPELPIIMLTGYPEGRTFFRSLIAGATGFLVKPVAAKEFLGALDDVLKGEFVLGRQVIPFLIQLVQQVREVTRESRLTAREEEILACLFQGMPDKEIASTLGIGTATVHTHMSRLFEKLDVHSRREIVAKYLAFN